METAKHTYRPPAPGESCVITAYTKFKRAALLFDKLHLTSIMFPLRSVIGDPPDEVLFCLPECEWISGQDAQRFQGMTKDLGETEVTSETAVLAALDASYRAIAANYSKKGIDVVPLYESELQFNNDFAQGSVPAYQGELQNIELVAEDGLSWEQVLQFREDRDAVRKYRALRSWLRDALQGKSVNEAADIIATKLDDYDWAIRRHGFKTVSSGLWHILDPATVAAVSGGTITSAVLAGPVAAALVGGITVGARVVTWLADRRLELEEIKRGQDSEVAIIYEAKKRFAGKDTT